MILDNSHNQQQNLGQLTFRILLNKAIWWKEKLDLSCGKLRQVVEMYWSMFVVISHMHCSPRIKTTLHDRRLTSPPSWGQLSIQIDCRCPFLLLSSVHAALWLQCHGALPWTLLTPPDLWLTTSVTFQPVENTAHPCAVNYCTALRRFSHFIPSSMYYHQADIEAAVARVKRSVHVCNKMRKKLGVMGSLTKTNYDEYTEGKNTYLYLCRASWRPVFWGGVSP